MDVANLTKERIIAVAIAVVQIGVALIFTISLEIAELSRGPHCSSHCRGC